MLEQQTETIGDSQYRVTQLGWKKGRRTLMRLMKVVGPALTESVESEGVPTDINAFSRTIKQLCEENIEGELDTLCDAFMPTTLVSTDGGDKWIPLKDIAELHFAGKYRDMFEWLWLCIKVNYSGFTEDFASIGGQLASLKAAESKSPKTSTGGRTESRYRHSTTTA